jgi:hypothetical protein
MINLKSEIQMKNIEREEIQLSLNQTQMEKLADTSYISTQFNTYQSEMNNIDDKINKLFNHPHNNKILHQHKSFNDEEEEYIQENRTQSLVLKDRKKSKKAEEIRKKKEIKKINKPNNESITMKNIIKIFNDSTKGENMNWLTFEKFKKKKKKKKKKPKPVL